MTNRPQLKACEYLRDPCPADAEVAGESGSILELAGVEQGLVMARELERIAAFLRSCRSLRFGVN
jgi:hypothetical protein